MLSDCLERDDSTNSGTRSSKRFISSGNSPFARLVFPPTTTAVPSCKAHIFCRAEENKQHINRYFRQTVSIVATIFITNHRNQYQHSIEVLLNWKGFPCWKWMSSKIIVGINPQVKCTSAESLQIVLFIKHKEKFSKQINILTQH